MGLQVVRDPILVNEMQEEISRKCSESAGWEISLFIYSWLWAGTT